MIKSITITPKFHTREIAITTFRKDWIRLQAEAFIIGEKAHRYIQNYINKNRKRTGGTGNLSNTINFYVEAGAGTGRVFWGIGDLSILNIKAKEWYVVNYGKTVGGIRYIPNYGKFIPGVFGAGDGRPKSEYAGKGVESFHKIPYSGYGMMAKHAIRPMHYIQATRHKVTRDLRLMFLKLKRG